VHVVVVRKSASQTVSPMRPNPSLKRSANGKPLGSRGPLVHVAPAGLVSCRCRRLSSNVSRL